MCIAVSAVIRPSRLWRATLVSYALANLGAGLFLACSPPAAFLLPQLLAACCLLAGCASAGALAASGKTRRIDISGLGQIRLTVQRNGGETDAHCMLVQLMPGSTVWPQWMMLLLRHDAGGAVTVLVLPDSVAPAQFRALAVAVRSLGGHDDKLYGSKHKIL
jgi:toxin CptA